MKRADYVVGADVIPKDCDWRVTQNHSFTGILGIFKQISV